MASITLRPPTFSPAKASTSFQNPSISWLTETWNVTHSSLPMWKSKKNVQIKYTPLEPSSPSIAKENTDRLDDLVTSQPLHGDKVSSIRGVDKVAGTGDSGGEWDWRGKGWLMIASSHWEILGWGEEHNNNGNKWAVTCFAKTLFTPAGIDVYSQSRQGVLPETLESIKAALAQVDDEGVKKMAKDLFEIVIDDSRKD
ncbi:hypothetical protein Slin15195_G052820 [Septoria linicola]|uniref:Uncharacterized protein n=1 Tax=Septoria linicola TaxID=215465 RepID=A0A9Q9EK24_9PEZI|nr:hypothetical protein Slin15195_G052820 [Septoria linicola]